MKRPMYAIVQYVYKSPEGFEFKQKARFDAEKRISWKLFWKRVYKFAKINKGEVIEHSYMKG